MMAGTRRRASQQPFEDSRGTAEVARGLRLSAPSANGNIPDLWGQTWGHKRGLESEIKNGLAPRES